MMLRLFLIICFALHSAVSILTEEELLKRNPNWETPDAWGRKEAALRRGEVNDEVAPTQTPEQTCSTHRDLYYRQLVRMLFYRHKFKRDAFEEGVVQRTINIKLTQKQLDKILSLVGHEDQMGELSEEVLKVFEHLEEGLKDIVVDQMFSYMELIRFKVEQIFSHPDVRFLACATLFVLICFVISKMTKCNFYFTLLMMAFVIHFLSKYIECNQRKQIKEIIKFKRSIGANPCSNIETEKVSWFDYLTRNSNREQCFEHMQKSATVDLGMCQPFEMIGNYAADVFINANSRIVQSFLDKFLDLISERGYFQGILITVLFCFIGFGFLKDIVGTVITSFIRYGIFGPRHPTAPQPAAAPPPPINSGIEDIREVLRETALQNQQLVTTFLMAQTVRQNETKAVESVEDLADPESMTRRSSDTESIEVIPDSLAGDEEDDFEHLRE